MLRQTPAFAGLRLSECPETERTEASMPQVRSSVNYIEWLEMDQKPGTVYGRMCCDATGFCSGPSF